MILQPLPTEIGLLDLRFTPIIMAGLRYGRLSALLSALVPLLYTVITDPMWLPHVCEYLLLPAVLSGFFHKKEYRTDFTRIPYSDGLEICGLLFTFHFAFQIFQNGDAIWYLLPGLFITLLITSIAMMIVIVMFNDENNTWLLQRKFELLAHQDSLTQLPNFRSFIGIAKDISQQRKIAILMIDLDNFKQYNDKLGHQAGDVLLRNASKLLRNNIENQDYVARYGGEEFILMSLETDPHRLNQYAHKLCHAIESHFQEEAHAKGVSPVTISIGISVSEQPNDDLHRVITESDTALYQSKRGGKNRYTLFHEMHPLHKGTTLITSD
jgi:diguanylate cyclase